MIKNDDSKEEHRTATTEEITEAINNLTTFEEKKLFYRASFRLNIASRGYNAADLLNEAITATLEGRRKWPINKVDFFGHLNGVMRSITSNWKEAKDALEKLSNPLPCDESSTIDIYDGHSSSLPSPEENVAAKQFLDKIEEFFSEDKVILDIIKCRIEDFKGPEIQELLGISKTQYETAIKRLGRKLTTGSLRKKVGC